ncbi:MAG: hypothetical protein HFH85_16885 [Lachnospiraceae bacterium]|jgi:hypothetical protein|nr:hypothetical protein [Lachnospiraceae bacterium]
MLKPVKRQIQELLHTLDAVKAEVRTAVEEENVTELLNLLADVQEAAVAIGDKVEEAAAEVGSKAEESVAGKVAECVTEVGSQGKESGIAVQIIGLLEEYCELLWEITQSQDGKEQLQLTEEAWGILKQAEQELRQIPEQTAVVFLPYKASMWDCMESVWLAARETPECVPFVVPIPYYDLKDGVVTARHYEGEMFPEYVPVTDYSSFPLAELHPGAVFVHNPFDDCNIVTTVLPQYYSGELKKVTDVLVYIPYFLTTGGVFVTHRLFPSYLNYDFIAVHDEKAIDTFAAELPREKFLPYGSTIAERILRLEREKPAIPEVWKTQLHNGEDFGSDRVVMLNTSISMLMKQRERFLNKIEYLFELVKHRKGITLVWRPHPLLAATAQTMGEKYAVRLAQLEEKFRSENIGVLDKTPDVGITVALCDAYLGEIASSVVNMFGIAGKPRFYINLEIPEDDGCNTPSDNRDDDRFVSAWCRDGEKEYFVLDKSGWIVERKKGSEGFTPLVQIPGRSIVWGRAYRGMEKKDESLLVYPENARGIFIYHMRTGEMSKVFGPQEAMYGEGQDYPDMLTLDEECLSVIRAERFKHGNTGHVWYENERTSVEDYFRFLQTAKDSEMISNQWPASMEGAGRKILAAAITGAKF